MKLSIGQAWDETKAILQTDGGAMLAVALALTVVPGAILETAAPSGLRTDDTSVWVVLSGLIVALLGLASQLAISRIALGPPTTVGEALALGFRRIPFLFGALLLAILPFALLVGALTVSQGRALEPQSIPSWMATLIFLVSIVTLYLLVRLLFLTPLAADRPIGSLALLKEAWRLSAGRALKLFLLLVLLALVGLIVLAGLGGALSAVIILALGEIAPGNLSALLVALIQQVLAGIVSVLFVVVLCRLYAQVAGGEGSVSVPNAGG